MRERLRNALNGFGFISDAQRDAEIQRAEEAPTVGRSSSPSLWGWSWRWSDPKAKGKL